MLTEILMSLFAIDSFRLWRRATTYPRIDHQVCSGEEPALLADYKVISAPGITIPQSALWQAVQWADDEGVLVADLIPADLPADRLLALLYQIHPTDFAQQPFASGVSAGVATLVHVSVLDLVPAPNYEGQSETEAMLTWIKYAKSLKRFAPWESALLYIDQWSLSAPELAIVLGNYQQRAVLLSELYGASVDQVKWATPIILSLLAYLVWSQPLWGSMTLAMWMLQPILILSGSHFKSNAIQYALFRPFYDIYYWLSTLQTRPRGQVHDLKQLKVLYQQEIAKGTDRFFQIELQACPICKDTGLTEHLVVPDFYQLKPGKFKLDRCTKCDHIFQNPQLNLDGLSFYYRDFYDGLGEQGMDMVFGATETSYRQRVAMVRAHGSPRRWLDVGGGHGHFALIAKHLLPQTSFDVLDLSESVEIAEQRAWCDQGIRGLFTELAPTLVGKYDGISMSHYLEHTPNPLAELDACAEVLDPGGMLMIEIPDPQSKVGRSLSRLWLPWFQPQHLHFMNTENLSLALQKRGFEVHEVDRSDAHQSVDFFFVAIIVLQIIAPDPNAPWRPEYSEAHKALLSLWRLIASLVFIPLILLGVILDRLARPLLARPGLSNTLRLLAIKESKSN
ncbi:MAG: hypothetical protein CMH49_05840 [Myxococcales bacterium]|nr:hypothetical protein [Myxococcales bacterium]